MNVNKGDIIKMPPRIIPISKKYGYIGACQVVELAEYGIKTEGGEI